MPKDYSRITGSTIWSALCKAQSILEKFGARDMEKNLPVLFAMYLYAARTMLSVPQETVGQLQADYRANLEELAQECLIAPGSVAVMLSAATAAAEKLTEALHAENHQENPNPIRALVRGTTEQLGVDRGDVNVVVAQNLTEFLIQCGLDANTIPQKHII